MKKIIFILFFPYTVNAVDFQFNFGAGFSDLTAVSPVGGNTGTTLGEQRQILFQAAANKWGERIQSNVTIIVEASFDTLFCSPNSVTLGSAGPFSASTGASPTPPLVANTSYPLSLLNAITGVDNFPFDVDIVATFNSQVDSGCFNGGTYYYGINGSAPPNTVQLYSTVLHELGHGLGFISNVSDSNGSFNGNPLIYDRFVFDSEADMFWTDMTDPQRFASLKNDPNVSWTGANVDNEASNFINSGFDPLIPLIRIHTPATVEPGSSAGHFSSAATPDLLMEPVLGNITFDQVDLTPALFKDIGYTITDPINNLIFKDSFEN